MSKSEKPSFSKPFTNRLANESSPYLRQHAHNPVDWYPWGPAALERARKEEKPIFLSIGYSACHWCHVMEHESFSDPEVAKVMNAHFINIKVDREERQDLDHIYMSAVQVMTQHGGWPMSVFLTPDLEPFYGGTYFPPEDRHAMPSFKKVLLGVANAWSTRRLEVVKSAGQLRQALEQVGKVDPSTEELSPDLLEAAYRNIASHFDAENGGFGNAPKFFHTMDLRLALRHWKRTGSEEALAVVTETLDRMGRGGIYDHLGGGFHRYSTDARWLVPHFEKMLYDNALLVDVYLEAYQATRRVEYAAIARETLDYVLREMTDADGGFYSTQDADTEGEEGRFYVWTERDISEVLDADLAEQFGRVYGVSARGNWEGKNILHLKAPLAETAQELGLEPGWLEDSLATAKRKLFAARAARVAPFRDEKILASWNGLMVEAMAKGYTVLGDERYREAAVAAGRFLLDRMVTVGREAPGAPPVYHAYQDGKSRLGGYLDDYAALVNACLSLYEADFDVAWVRSARAIADCLLEQFWDEGEGGFFFTARDHEKLILRPKEWQDGATPSGTSLAVTALFRLARLTGEDTYADRANKTLRRYGDVLRNIPLAAGQMLIAYELSSQDPLELVIAGGSSPDETEAMLRVVRDPFLPNKVVALRREKAGEADEKTLPLLQGRGPREGRATLYLCRNFTCLDPFVGAEAAARGLGGQAP